MERRERRRRDFFNSLFDPDPNPIGSAFEVRVLNQEVAGRFDPATPVAKLWNGNDEVFVVPGQIQATVGSAAEAALREREDFRVVASSGRVTTFAIRGDGGAPSTRAALAVLAQYAGERTELGELTVAPVHGFLAQQHVLGAEDPELTDFLQSPEFGSGFGLISRLVLSLLKSAFICDI